MTSYTEEALFALLEHGGADAHRAALALWEGTRPGGGLLRTPTNSPVGPLVNLARRLEAAETGLTIEQQFFLRLARRHVVAHELTRLERSAYSSKPHELLAELPPVVELPDGMPPEVEHESIGYYDVRLCRDISDVDLSRSHGPPTALRKKRCRVCAALDWEPIADFGVGGNAGGWDDQWFRCRCCRMYTQEYREFG